MTTEELKKKIDGLFFGLHSTNPGDINALPEILNYLLENAGGAKQITNDMFGEITLEEALNWQNSYFLKYADLLYSRFDWYLEEFKQAVATIFTADDVLQIWGNNVEIDNGDISTGNIIAVYTKDGDYYISNTEI